MRVKHYGLGAMFAAVVSLALSFWLWIISLLGWGFVWGLFAILLLPRCYRFAQEYHESGDLFTDFLQDKFERRSHISHIS